MYYRKLKFMPYAQAHINEINGNVLLVSYQTIVAEITRDGWFTCYGLYSATTRRHIGAFCKEMVTFPNGCPMSYQDAKSCYTGNYSLNVHTGEVRFRK